jgi:hypothetical protein
VHGADASGHVVLRKPVMRDMLLVAQPWCTVALDACGGARPWMHGGWGKLGHAVRLIPPAQVKPCVKPQVRPAEAICEAATRLSMRLVPVGIARGSPGAVWVGSGGRGLCPGLGIVVRLCLGGRCVSDQLQQASAVEPVHPVQGGELDGLRAAPRTTPMDHLRLEQAIDRPGQRVVVAIANAVLGTAVPCPSNVRDRRPGRDGTGRDGTALVQGLLQRV